MPCRPATRFRATRNRFSQHGTKSLRSFFVRHYSDSFRVAEILIRAPRNRSALPRVIPRAEKPLRVARYGYARRDSGQRSVQSSASLLHPIAYADANPFDILRGKIAAMHNYIAGSFHGVEDILNPLLSLQEVFEIRPIRVRDDYAM